MNFAPKYYIWLCICIGMIVIFAMGDALSNRHVRHLEMELANATKLANEASRLANEKETEAAAYQQKVIYLDKQISDIQILARTQDEQLKKLSDNTNNARRDADRAGNIRTINATTAQLCVKLAELGHAC